MLVYVAYASEKKQLELAIDVSESCTVKEAILQSGILEAFPEIDIEALEVGIHSKRAEITQTLKPLDRVEIYRPLIIDPKEARRLRARRSKQ